MSSSGAVGTEAGEGSGFDLVAITSVLLFLCELISLTGVLRVEEGMKEGRCGNGSRHLS